MFPCLGGKPTAKLSKKCTEIPGKEDATETDRKGVHRWLRPFPLEKTSVKGVMKAKWGARVDPRAKKKKGWVHHCADMAVRDPGGSIEKHKTRKGNEISGQTRSGGKFAQGRTR